MDNYDSLSNVLPRKRRPFLTTMCVAYAIPFLPSRGHVVARAEDSSLRKAHADDGLCHLTCDASAHVKWKTDSEKTNIVHHSRNILSAPIRTCHYRIIPHAGVGVLSNSSCFEREAALRFQRITVCFVGAALLVQRSIWADNTAPRLVRATVQCS
ncbi:hypothetical protein NM688_g1582 [Phlebia brevispora]|uniref:Uncharacterized protein n=1 Tax=Phlebia brevispora TaxID=194682 RepID=A0ACC1TBR4_9APHY|nr:hypothetical protein NM688_g1582 [Phlebia brevispora]